MNLLSGSPTQILHHSSVWLLRNRQKNRHIHLPECLSKHRWCLLDREGTAGDGGRWQRLLMVLLLAAMGLVSHVTAAGDRSTFQMNCNFCSSWFAHNRKEVASR